MSDGMVHFAIYVVATGDIVQMGGCAAGDLALQGLHREPGLAVMEIEPAQESMGAYRVDLSGERPRLVRIGV